MVYNINMEDMDDIDFKKNKEILIIEDDPMDQELIKAQLQSVCSAELTFAKSLREAAIKYRNFKYDLMFLDLNLPDNFGISSVVDARKFFPKTPIVVMTGLASDLTKSEARKAGAKSFLIKSRITQDQIIKVLSSVA